MIITGLKKYPKLLSTLVLITVVAIGAYAIAQSSLPSLSFEAETGSRTGNADVVNDSSASGSSALHFFASPSGGTGSCPQPKRVITASDVTNRTNSGYPAGTEVYVPDGPDPWGGCFPGPGTTGIPAGTTLTNYTGPCTITTANTTIDSKIINCNMSIRAANVTIRNSRITASDIGIDSGSLLFEDNEVNFGSNINGNGLVGSNFVVRRSNMYGGKRQVWCANTCTLENSYLHDQLADPTGVAHESAARVEQHSTFRHNTLWCNAPNYPPDAGCSANQTGYPDFAPIHHNTFERNLYMATTGGYCSYGGGTNGKPFSNHADNATYIVSKNNVFQRGTAPNDKSSIALTDKRRYTCGYYGATTDYRGGRAGFEFTGNMWDDGLLFANDTSYPYGAFY